MYIPIKLSLILVTFPIIPLSIRMVIVDSIPKLQTDTNTYFKILNLDYEYLSIRKLKDVRSLPKLYVMSSIKLIC